MPLDASKRRRVEIPADLYNDIARDATALHMPIQTLIISMLARTLKADRARALIPMRDRRAPEALYAEADYYEERQQRRDLAVSDQLEAELQATREARRVK